MICSWTCDVDFIYFGKKAWADGEADFIAFARTTLENVLPPNGDMAGNIWKPLPITLDQSTRCYVILTGSPQIFPVMLEKLLFLSGS